MKVLSRIFYYSVLSVIILAAMYNLIRKAVISPVIKKSIIEHVGPAMGADVLSIGDIHLGPGTVRAIDIVYEKENAKVGITDFYAEYSLFEVITEIFRSRKPAFKLVSVRIKGCRIVVDPETRPSSEDKWEFKFDEFERLISFLKNTGITDDVTIEDLDIIYISDLGLHLVRDMNGFATYDSYGIISIDMKGRLLNSDTDNITLKGELSLIDSSAEFSLDVIGGRPVNFRFPFGGNRISAQEYRGSAGLRIVGGEKKEFNLYGDLDVRDMEASVRNRIFFDDTSFSISFLNGLTTLEQVQGNINGIPFKGRGMFFGNLAPNGDLFFDIKNISDSSLEHAVKVSGFDHLSHHIPRISDNNSLELHVYGDLQKPSADFNISIGALEHTGVIIQDIVSSGTYRPGEVRLRNLSGIVFGTSMNAEGIIDNFGGKEFFNYDLNIKGSGAPFRQTGIFTTENLYNNSILLSGRLKGGGKNYPSVDAKIQAFEHGPELKPKWSFSIFSENGGAEGSLVSPDGHLISQAAYSMKNGNYIVSGDDLSALYSIIYGDFPLNDQSIGFELRGDTEEVHVTGGSADPSSLFYGRMDAKFDLKRPVLESFVNWAPGSTSSVTKPMNFRVRRSGRLVYVSDIYFDYGMIKGEVAVNLHTSAIYGDLDAWNVDLGRYFAVPGLSTRTDLSLKFRGTAGNYSTDIFLNENILKYRSSSGKSLEAHGEAKGIISASGIDIKNLKVYRGLNNIITSSGFIKRDGSIEAVASGVIPAEILNPFFERFVFTGDIDYGMELTGSLRNLRLKNSEIAFRKGSVNGHEIRSAELSTAELDSSGVLVRRFFLDAGRTLNVDAEGFLPYDDSGIFVTGIFYGDLLNFLQQRTHLISRAYSAIEGKFTLGGSYRSPRIRDLELYVIDGGFRMEGLKGGFDRIRSKMSMGSDSRLIIEGFNMRSRATNGLISLGNSFEDKNHESIILPGDINIGHLMLSSTDAGFDYSVPGMMLERDYGNFVPGGFNDEYFRIFRSNGNITGSGTILVKNSKITFPLIETGMAEKLRRADRDTPEILKNIKVDVEFIPGSGNSYFYNIDIEAKTVWERIRKSFTRIDDDLNNVMINIISDRRGLRLKGLLSDPGALDLSGTLRGRNGTCNFSAFTFRVNDASITFDGRKNARGFADPYLRAVGRTTVKTKADSLGYSGYENVFIRVVTSDDGVITDSDGARISDFSIILTDEYGNLWMEREENITGLDTRATVMEMFNEAFDARFFSPFISPIEYALGRMLGATVLIRPSISRNFIQRELGILDIPEHYADYFLGSEFFISKFVTDNVAFTWNTRYIGTEQYIEIAERRYGYRNRLSVDYVINNYIMTSAGYEYDSIQDQFGYNISLMYSYRFFNISEPYNYVKNFLRLK